MFGHVLRKYRKHAGLTQEQLANKAGIHRTYVSLLERNEKSPTLKVFFRLCSALQAKPSEVIEAVEMDLTNQKAEAG